MPNPTRDRRQFVRQPAPVVADDDELDQPAISTSSDTDVEPDNSKPLMPVKSGPLRPYQPPQEDDQGPPTGTTGGLIPQQANDMRPSSRLSDDPAVRGQQALAAAQEQFKDQQLKQNPFLFSPAIKKIEDFVGRQGVAHIQNQADQNYVAQSRSDRAAAVADLRAQQEAIKVQNATREAEFRGTGQQFYTDPFGHIQPVIEPGTKRPLYKAKPWAPSTDPKTGLPALGMSDKYGQRQFKAPALQDSIDPHDEHLYAKNETGEYVPYMTKEEAAKSKDLKLAKMGMAALKRKNTAGRLEAMQLAQDEANDTRQQVVDAHAQLEGFDSQIADLSAKANDSQIDPVQRDGLLSLLAQSQGERDALAEKIKPHGDLARKQWMSSARLNLMRAQARKQTAIEQRDQIAARLKEAGMSDDQIAQDPTYQANEQTINQATSEETVHNTGIQRSEALNQRRQMIQQPGAPSAAPAPENADVFQQREPFMLASKGIKNIGGLSIDRIAKMYGYGRGVPDPASLIKIKNDLTAAEQTLATAPGPDSQVTDKRRAALQEEATYLDGLYKQRLARLAPEQQQQVIDATRDSTLLEKASGAIKTGAERAAEGGGAVLKGLETVAALLPAGPSGIPNPAFYLDDHAKMRVFKDGPAYQLGGFIQDAAKEFYAKAPTEQRGTASEVLNTISGEAGGFAPLLASGPAAPLTVGLQSTGDGMEQYYNDAVAKGATPQRAADVALKRALASGAVQAAIFEFLPKPLQKAADKYLVDKIAKGALTRFLANRVAQATEGGILGGASQVAENVVAGNDVTENVAPAAGGLAAIQSVMPRGGRQRPTEPGKGAGTAPVAPEPSAGAAAAEARRAARLKEGNPLPGESVAKKIENAIDAPKSAEESAQVFEPALKERENQAPPQKSAAESAQVFAKDAQDTRNAAVAEEAAQRLVDEVQDASGKPREEILASRKNADGTSKPIEQWANELQSEAEYQRSPHTVDPERRSTELRADIAKLDQEWKRHTDQATAEAEQYRRQAPAKEVAAANFEAEKARQRDLMSRRDAMESELEKLDRLRQSPEGSERLSDQLGDQAKEAVANARRLATPELEARRDAMESGLEAQEQLRKSSVGAAKLKADLASQSSKQAPVEFAGVQEGADGKPVFTTYRLTEDIPGHPKGSSVTDKTLAKEGYDITNLPKETAATPEKPINAPEQEAPREATLRQENEPARIGGEPIVRAEGNEARDVREEGKPDAKGQGDVAVQQVQEKVKLPKDAAPVSAHVTESTPESVEGKKINKEWTAFDKGSGTLGIPRAEMPQIKSEARGALTNFLRARGIETKAGMLNPTKIKPTQAEFSPGKVEDARKHQGPERPILISSDNHVVDGHHQWLAGLDDKTTPMPVIRLNAPIDKILAEMKEFPSAKAAEGAAPKPEAKAEVKPAQKRLSDRAIEVLQNAKYNKGIPGSLGVTGEKSFQHTPFTLAWDSAMDVATLAIRAGREVTDITKMAVARFKSKFPDHTAEDIADLESTIQKAHSDNANPPPNPTAKSALPESLREVGVPAESINYEVRKQSERKAEAKDIIKSKGVSEAERMMADDKNLPGDTRVALGGQLINERMAALKNAKPEEMGKITRDIRRIAAKMQPELTEAGQQIAMTNSIYQDARVASGIEYIKSVTKERVKRMGGKKAEQAAQEVADIFNDTKDQAARDKAIEKLKEKYTEGPVRKMLNELKRVEAVKELNELGVLTRDDMLNVAGNALGLPGISKEKLKTLADLADKIDTAKNHAERTKAELELADTLSIYKGVEPLDLESSILTLNIMSGYTTQLGNLAGNTLNSLAQLGTTAASNPTKLPELTKGFLHGVGLGVDQAKSILVTGRGTKDLQDKTSMAGHALQTIDYARDFPKLNETAGNVLTKRARLVEKVGRLMKAADAVFYYPAREAYARMAATKMLETGGLSGDALKAATEKLLHTTPEAFKAAKDQAAKEGYSGVDQARRVADIIEEQRATTPEGKETVKQSEQFAAETTYNNEPNGLAGVIYRHAASLVDEARIAKVQALKPWLMFLRVPTNVFNATTNYTPLGAVRAKFGVAGEKQGEWRNFNKDERNRLYVQSLVGASLMGGLVARAMTNNDMDVSASGPSNPAQRKQLQNSGWKPYSIKIGDKWVSYKDSPLLVPLSIVGHVVDSVRYQKSKSDMALESKVVDAISQAPQVIFQTSMLSSFADLMATMSGKGGADGVSRTLSSIPANLIIPYNRLFQQIDQTFDDKTYDTNAIAQSVPFVRRLGAVKTDVEGRDQKYSPLDRFATTETNDPLDKALRAKNVFIPEVGKDVKLGNRVMTDDERDTYRRISGQRIRARLLGVANRFNLMTQEQVQKEVKRITDEERDKAKVLVQRMPVKR